MQCSGSNTPPSWSLPFFLPLHNHRMLFSLIEVFCQYASWVLGLVQKTILSKANKDLKKNAIEKSCCHWNSNIPSLLYRVQQTTLKTPVLSSHGSRVPGILTKKSEASMTSERGRLSSSPVPLNRAFCQGPSFKSKSMCSCLGPSAERFLIVLWGLAALLTCWRGSFRISLRYQLLPSLWHVLPHSEHDERRRISATCDLTSPRKPNIWVKLLLKSSAKNASVHSSILYCTSKMNHSKKYFKIAGTLHYYILPLYNCTDSKL